MTTTFSHSTYDVIVVGARCAGAATAMLLARQGARVLLVERDPDPGDTLSTHALMRPAVTLLDAWGLLPAIRASGTPPVRKASFVYGHETVEVPIAPLGGAEGLYAPRRTVLDAILRDAASRSGAEYRAGIAFEDVVRDAGGRVTGARLRDRTGAPIEVPCGILIGADGRRSAVAASVGARVLEEAAACCSTIYGYVPGLPDEGYTWFFSSGVAGGAIPTTDGEHCVFLSRPAQHAARFGRDALTGLATGLAIWSPQIAEAVRRGAPRLRRFAGAPGHLRDCVGPGWALVGDAGYFKDPVTAHGITDALLDAHRLAHALSGPGGAASYQQARDAYAPALLALTHRIATLDWSMDELAAMHREFAGFMKAEAADIASFAKAPRRAA
jgi:2-polyprenyl-6-methoxyphenol hydroxylase-like FAD-dependent oxidoreductase